MTHVVADVDVVDVVDVVVVVVAAAAAVVVQILVSLYGQVAYTAHSPEMLARNPVYIYIYIYRVYTYTYSPKAIVGPYIMQVLSTAAGPLGDVLVAQLRSSHKSRCFSTHYSRA